MRCLLNVLLIAIALLTYGQFPSFPSWSNQTLSYHDAMSWWDSLATYSLDVKRFDYGMTDAGYPLTLMVFNSEANTIEELENSERPLLLINNAIHPGEPDGVNASMKLFYDLAIPKFEVYPDLTIVCIPFYNIGGALNRNSHSRANQDGPIEYGFRGNAQNLDLNRDFMKCDSRNAMTFTRLLQLLDPQMYIETHVSNGADYQYTMTYLSTQPDKLGYALGEYLKNDLTPGMEARMANKGDAMIPYVNVWGRPLDSTYDAFYDSPRFSTGLATLHQIPGYITETHMLKPFDQRVRSTYNFLNAVIEMMLSKYDPTTSKAQHIQRLQHDDRVAIAQTDGLPLDWEIDRSRYDLLNFKGYAYEYRTSDVSSLPRLYYDRDRPIDIPLKYYGYMKPTIVRSKPKAYIVKAGYVDVVDRLRANGVKMEQLQRDTLIEVVSYLIGEHETVKTPYEKHYVHSNTHFHRETLTWSFLKGDLIVYMGAQTDRFVMEALEPDGPDSYFNWNFFDAILQQKEWFSAYVFEDIAAQWLNDHPEVVAEFEAMKYGDSKFAADAFAQLYWVYRQTPYYEKEHRRMPVFRVE